MLLLTVNAGSTSVKLAAFAADSAADAPPRELARERHAGRDLDAATLLGALLARLAPAAPAAIAHRVVHGGTRFTAPERIDGRVAEAIAALSALAPLHNPVALAWIDAARAVCGPEVAQIAAFDTAFFARLPRRAAEYALPASLGTAQGVRRYGFHGLAHEAMWRRWCELRPELPRGGRLITLQLGGGCSMAAIGQGAPLDTSMGFSPLEGLVMATRSGDIDAAVVPFLATRLGWSAERVLEALNRESGLLGLAGRSSMGELVGDARDEARFAVEIYCYRVLKQLGAYLAALGGCDGIVFGGGVGEHIPEVRRRVLAPLEWAGICLDEEANARACGTECRISAPASRIDVHVVPVDEESSLARAALECLRQARGGRHRLQPER